MTMADFRLIRLLPLAALVLTACTTTAPEGPATSPDSPQWQQHREQVNRISQFETRGAFACLSERQKVYARFFWQQTSPERYRLLLINPLGSTELQLDVGPGHVQLVDNKGQRYADIDAEDMIGKLTGMPIPVNSLRQWILGVPGNATDYKLDARYRLSELTYAHSGKSWKVTYNGYDTSVQPPVPSSMELREGNLRIKLKMDSWAVK